MSNYPNSYGNGNNGHYSSHPQMWSGHAAMTPTTAHSPQLAHSTPLSASHSPIMRPQYMSSYPPPSSNHSSYMSSGNHSYANTPQDGLSRAPHPHATMVGTPYQTTGSHYLSTNGGYTSGSGSAGHPVPASAVSLSSQMQGQGQGHGGRSGASADRYGQQSSAYSGGGMGAYGGGYMPPGSGGIGQGDGSYYYPQNPHAHPHAASHGGGTMTGVAANMAAMNAAMAANMGAGMGADGSMTPAQMQMLAQMQQYMQSPMYMQYMHAHAHGLPPGPYQFPMGMIMGAGMSVVKKKKKDKKDKKDKKEKREERASESGSKGGHGGPHAAADGCKASSSVAATASSAAARGDDGTHAHGSAAEGRSMKGGKDLPLPLAIGVGADGMGDGESKSKDTKGKLASAGGGKVKSRKTAKAALARATAAALGAAVEVHPEQPERPERYGYLSVSSAAAAAASGGSTASANATTAGSKSTASGLHASVSRNTAPSPSPITTRVDTWMLQAMLNHVLATDIHYYIPPSPHALLQLPAARATHPPVPGTGAVVFDPRNPHTAFPLPSSSPPAPSPASQESVSPLPAPLPVYADVTGRLPDSVGVLAQRGLTGRARLTRYWVLFDQYLRAQVSKLEFDSQVLSLLGPHYVKLHNAFIMGILRNARAELVPPATPKGGFLALAQSHRQLLRDAYRALGARKALGRRKRPPPSQANGGGGDGGGENSSGSVGLETATPPVSVAGAAARTQVSSRADAGAAEVWRGDVEGDGDALYTDVEGVIAGTLAWTELDVQDQNTLSSGDSPSSPRTSAGSASPTRRPSSSFLPAPHSPFVPSFAATLCSAAGERVAAQLARERDAVLSVAHLEGRWSALGVVDGERDSVYGDGEDDGEDVAEYDRCASPESSVGGVSVRARAYGTAVDAVVREVVEAISARCCGCTCGGGSPTSTALVSPSLDASACVCGYELLGEPRWFAELCHEHHPDALRPVHAHLPPARVHEATQFPFSALPCRFWGAAAVLAAVRVVNGSVGRRVMRVVRRASLDRDALAVERGAVACTLPVKRKAREEGEDDDEDDDAHKRARVGDATAIAVDVRVAEAALAPCTPAVDTLSAMVACVGGEVKVALSDGDDGDDGTVEVTKRRTATVDVLRAAEDQLEESLYQTTLRIPKVRGREREPDKAVTFIAPPRRRTRPHASCALPFSDALVRELEHPDGNVVCVDVHGVRVYVTSDWYYQRYYAPHTRPHAPSPTIAADSSARECSLAHIVGDTAETVAETDAEACAVAHTHTHADVKPSFSLSPSSTLLSYVAPGRRHVPLATLDDRPTRPQPRTAAALSVVPLSALPALLAHPEVSAAVRARRLTYDLSHRPALTSNADMVAALRLGMEEFPADAQPQARLTFTRSSSDASSMYCNYNASVNYTHNPENIGWTLVQLQQVACYEQQRCAVAAEARHSLASAAVAAPALAPAAAAVSAAGLPSNAHAHTHTVYGSYGPTHATMHAQQQPQAYAQSQASPSTLVCDAQGNVYCLLQSEGATYYCRLVGMAGSGGSTLWCRPVNNQWVVMGVTGPNPHATPHPHASVSATSGASVSSAPASNSNALSATPAHPVTASSNAHVPSQHDVSARGYGYPNYPSTAPPANASSTTTNGAIGNAENSTAAAATTGAGGSYVSVNGQWYYTANGQTYLVSDQATSQPKQINSDKHWSLPSVFIKVWS